MKYVKLDIKKILKLGNDMIEVIKEFCCLGGVVESSGDNQQWWLEYDCVGWQKFNVMSQEGYYVGEFCHCRWKDDICTNLA